MDREISVGFIVSSRERPKQPVGRDEFCRLLIASRSEMSWVDFVRQVWRTWGRKAIVVRTPATNPTISATSMMGLQ
jgi:hypothetical protein